VVSGKNDFAIFRVRIRLLGVVESGMFQELSDIDWYRPTEKGNNVLRRLLTLLSKAEPSTELPRLDLPRR
jgi:hypothetical protein